jgi:E3 ubiquitin-protein ligase HUWE1
VLLGTLLHEHDCCNNRCPVIQVTDENKHEYVQLLARHKMTESIKSYIRAFCEGLWSCIPLESLRIFSPEQLGLLIAGQQHISAKDMMACTRYEGFSGEEECIKWFWDIVKEMDQKSMAKLLAFITGVFRLCLRPFV